VFSRKGAKSSKAQGGKLFGSKTEENGAPSTRKKRTMVRKKQPAPGGRDASDGVEVAF